MQLSQNEYITYKKPNHSENIGRVYDVLLWLEVQTHFD
jgi:hypothetical protein